jgi:hypothetical protein
MSLKQWWNQIDHLKTFKMWTGLTYVSYRSDRSGWLMCQFLSSTRLRTTRYSSWPTYENAWQHNRKVRSWCYMTNPVYWIYPAWQPDMSSSQVARYIQSVHTPSNPRPLSFHSTSLVVALRALMAIWGLLHRILGISRGFPSPPLSFLQTLGGFLSPKVFPWFFVDSF